MSASKILAGRLRKEALVGRGAERVLLINPPVYDTRFHWAKWTQPTQLLRLASYFGARKTSVKLVDALSTGPGRIRKELIATVQLEDAAVNQWRFGISSASLASQMGELAKTKWIPDQIFVEGITTFWWKGAQEAVALAKKTFPKAQVILLGSYPSLAPSHAANKTRSDHVLVGQLPATVGLSTDVSVYDRPPGFAYVLLGAGVRSVREVVEEITRKTTKEHVRHVAFADHPLGSSEDQVRHLQKVLESLMAHEIRVRLYALGNIAPSALVEHKRLANVMRRAGFAEIHFADDRVVPRKDGSEDQLVEDYQRATELCHQAGFEKREMSISAGLCIGRLGEDLARRAELATRLAHVVGSLIIWPYQPTPKECGTLSLERQNGKLFPFRKKNGATYREYLGLIGLATVLNAKYRRRSFDFLGQGLAPRLFRRSLTSGAFDPPNEVKGSLRVIPAERSSIQPTQPLVRTVTQYLSPGKRSAAIVTDSHFEIASGPRGFKRALLLNPPVYDAQYWARWSQPAGLLRIATYLKRCGFSIDLVDCMETDTRGYVPKTRRMLDGVPQVLKRDDITKAIHHFGTGWQEVERRLRQLEPPNEVWITSIMTYWWESTRDAVSLVRRVFPKARVIVGGIYPTLAPEHAAEHLGADVIFQGELSAASGLPTDLSLYSRPPTYAILTTTRGCPWECHYCAARALNGGSNKMRAREPEDVIDEIEYKVKTYGIRRFGFYEDNALVLRGHLQRVLELIIERKLKLQLYAPEGFETRLLTVDLLKAMKQSGFEKVHLPFEALRWETNLGWNRRHASTASFELALDAAIQAGFRPRTEEINAFVLFGLPDDALEYLADSVSYVHHTVGSIIPMLFTPVPGTQIYKQQEDYLLREKRDGKRWDFQDLNGKFLPFLEYNRGRYPGLRASDYLEFEGLMSILNNGKVLGQSFDLCGVSRASQGFMGAMMNIVERTSRAATVG